MRPASRTPEGQPNRCPMCGRAVRLEPSSPPGDAPCPSCGHLLWFPRGGVVNRRRPLAVGVAIILVVTLALTVGYATLPAPEWGILTTLAAILFAKQIVATAGAAWHRLVFHAR